MATPKIQQPELDALSPANRLLLQSMVEAMAGLHPQPGVLHNLPQVTVSPEDLARACRIAKDAPSLNANQLLCLACVDYQDSFQLAYFLRSLPVDGPPVRAPAPVMIIKAVLPYDDPRAPSVVSVWPAADWYEREAHDLFGVVFDDHPNLTPLLLYDGFEGFPGRKSFPLNDYQEF